MKHAYVNQLIISSELRTKALASCTKSMKFSAIEQPSATNCASSLRLLSAPGRHDTDTKRRNSLLHTSCSNTSCSCEEEEEEEVEGVAPGVSRDAEAWHESARGCAGSSSSVERGPAGLQLLLLLLLQLEAEAGARRCECACECACECEWSAEEEAAPPMTSPVEWRRVEWRRGRDTQHWGSGTLEEWRGRGFAVK